eukprot:scaffold13555_cov57-Phaeocystis_antarctica.AAC.3
MVINQGSIGTGHGDNYLKGRMSETKAKLSGGYATEGSNPGLGGRGPAHVLQQLPEQGLQGHQG